MAALQSLVDDPRAGDRAQQSLLVNAFKAFAWILSDTRPAPHADGGRVNLVAPTRFMGRGRIVVRGLVTFGVFQSPFLLQGLHIEARTPQSRVEIDEGTFINNGASIISEGGGISIGKRCLIGPMFSCADSNFHDLDVGRRAQMDPDPRPVVIEDDVFIGDGVKVLKGVRVGRGSILAAGAVLFPGFTCPPNSTVRGNPAVVVATRPDAEPAP